MAATDPLEGTTCYTYDANSRLTQVRRSSGAAISWQLDAEGNIVRVVDANGEATVLEYCGQGLVRRSVQPDGEVVEYLYDTEERLVEVVNQRCEVYRIDRDPLGRISRETDYWGQSRNYRFSPAGRVVAIEDCSGRRIDYVTDALGRVVRKTLSDGSTEEFAYDKCGNLTQARNALIEVSRTYDAEGRLTEEAQGSFVVRNSYDPAGNRVARETSTGNRVEYEFDPLDAVSTVRVNGEELVRNTRDGVGRILEETLFSTVQRRRRYDADGLLAELAVAPRQAAPLDVIYGRDQAGNLTSRRESGRGMDAYRYDAIGRVVEHISPRGISRHYAYDQAGDRMATHVVESEPDWIRAGMLGEVRYRFDRTGNLAERRDQDGDLHLVWDAARRLVASDMNGVVTNYGYDPLGRRIFKQTDGRRVDFFWDGDALVGEACSNPGQAAERSSREYVYQDQTLEPLAVIAQRGSETRVSCFHNEPNGLPTRLLGPTGDTLWQASFDPFGNVDSEFCPGDAINVRFQGQYYDIETGLCYNRNRYYDPGAGIYVSQDPIGILAGDSLYQYAPNTFSWVDLLGLACKPIALGLDPFFKNLPGIHWKNWAKEGITRRTVTNRFGRAFHEAADRASHIHFALDRIGETPEAIARAVQKGKAGFSVAARNMTNAELHHIATNPELFDKTTFYIGEKALKPDEVGRLFSGVR
jgi:RHS repeat-associated protein